MCRNIIRLRFPDRQPTEAELQAAALQYVRKITGYRQPSKANQAAFDQAVAEITRVTQQLFEKMQPSPAAVRHAAYKE
jgi:hypothetical protein